jgi:hypothetical protein
MLRVRAANAALRRAPTRVTRRLLPLYPCTLHVPSTGLLHVCHFAMVMEATDWTVLNYVCAMFATCVLPGTFWTGTAKCNTKCAPLYMHGIVTHVNTMPICSVQLVYLTTAGFIRSADTKTRLGITSEQHLVNTAPEAGSLCRLVSPRLW